MMTRVRGEILETRGTNSFNNIVQLGERQPMSGIMDTEKRPLKIIAGGIIHQMSNKSVYIEKTRITGITEDKM